MSVISMVVGATTQSAATFAVQVDDGPVRVAVADNAAMSGPALFGPSSVDARGVANQSVASSTNPVDDDELFLFMATDGTSQSTANGVFAYRVETTQQGYGLPTSGNSAAYERGLVVTAGEDGDLQMRSNQAASTSTATIVGSRSYLKIRRIA